MNIYRCAACGAVNRTSGGGGARCERCRSALDTSGAPQRIDAAALVTLIASSPAPVLVDFASPGVCASCLDEVASARAGEVLCLRVDTAGEPAAAAAYRVRQTPTVVLFARGAELARFAPTAPGGAAGQVSRWEAQARLS